MRNILFIVFAVLTVNTYSFENLQNKFIQNKGQLFNDQGFQENEILYYLPQQTVKYYIRSNSINIVTESEVSKLTVDNSARQIFRYDIEFPGSNTLNKSFATGKSQMLYNFFKGNLEFKDINSFSKLTFFEFYKNIDLVYHIEKEIFKYDFILHPGSDPNDISFKLNGVYSYYISADGNLVIETPNGVFRKPKPIVFQYDDAGNINYIDADYLINNGLIKFVLNEKYNLNRNLTIDPEVGLLSYCGGSSNDGLYAIKQDIDRNYYLSGESNSSDFPVTVGSLQPQKSYSIDGVIMRFDDKWQPIWITYFGGSGNDRFMDLNIGDNHIWVTGETTSADYPVTVGSYQPYYGGGSGDIALTKISKDSKLLYSSCMGSSRYDSSPESCIDKFGNLWITGRTNSSFPITFDAEQDMKGLEYSGFIAKFSPLGKLMYSSYVSGFMNVYGEGITNDSDGNIYITGYTDSGDLPNINNGFQSKNGGNYDAFVTKFDNNGKSLWSTFIGGYQDEYCSNIEVDDNNNIYVFGHTASNDFPLAGNPYQKNLKAWFDGFIAKISPDSKLIWSTYFGGNNFDGYENSIAYQLAGLQVANGTVAVAASTLSTDLPVTPDAYQKTIGGAQDAFIALFNTDSGDLTYCTYFGGRGIERPYDILFDQSGKLMNVGRTYSDNLKTETGVFQKNYGGAGDGYIYGVSSDLCRTVIDYTTFDNVDKVYLNGDAQYVDDYIRMTLNKPYQSSSMWYIDKIGIQKGFETNFSFSITEGQDSPGYLDTPYPGADGIAFIMQTNSILIKGEVGGSIGFQGIASSIAVEYDMFENTEGYINDPNGNHIAVFSNGKLPNVCNHKSKNLYGQTLNVPDFNIDGSVYYSKIIYDGNTNSLKVFVAESPFKLTEPVLTLENFNIAEILEVAKSESIWIGFTSATGGSYQKHNIHSWNLCSYDDDLTSVNESIDIFDNHIEISPNPASDFITISLPENYNHTLQGAVENRVQIFNTLGIEVLSVGAIHELPLLKIDISSFPVGVYFIKIGDRVEKFVKM